MKRILPLICILAFLGSVLWECKKVSECDNCLQNKRSPAPVGGDDRTIRLPVDSIYLDGSKSSDVEGWIAEWKWTKILGPACEIVSPDDSVTLVRKLLPGIYRFELRVTDNGGSAASDTVQVTVLEANRPPIANAGTDSKMKLIDETIILDGSRSGDPDRDSLIYSWKQIFGPTVATFQNSNLAVSNVSGIGLGTYQFELTVSDTLGLSDKDTVEYVMLEPCESLPGGYSFHMRITLPLDSVWIDDLWGDGEWYCWKKIGGPDSYQIEYQFESSNIIRKLVPGKYVFLRIPVTNAGPSDSVMLEVVDDPNELNTVEYKNLSWNYYGVTSAWSDSIVLIKPWWWDNSNARKTEVYLQVSDLNGNNWFSVPSTQSGVSFSLNCYDNCLRGLAVAAPLAQRNKLEGKKTNLKVKIL